MGLLFSLIPLGVWVPYLLTPPPQLHNHHIRMTEHVSIPCRGVEPY